MQQTLPDWSKTQINLKKHEVHLWQINPLDFMGCPLLEQYKDLLTDEETQKQQKYKFAKDQHNALITRAFIRDLLSYYADVPPQNWCFVKGDKDKPEILNPPLPLRFNLSHTNNMIVCAVTLDEDIGCDVENIERNSDVLSIASHYFSVSETQELFALPDNQQSNRFFDYWTLKESYIKAWGLGLSIPLMDFSFHIQKPLRDEIWFNDKIKLSFASHRIDHPETWRSWLFYPNKNNRIALSIRAKSNNQNTAYKLRYFHSYPLLGYKESNTIG